MKHQEVKNAYIDYVINKLDDFKDNDCEMIRLLQERFTLDVGDNPNLIGEFTFRMRELQPWEKGGHIK